MVVVAKLYLQVMKNVRLFTLALLAVSLGSGCVATKKKNSDVGWFKKGYHNLTSKYNYWFNADELLYLTKERQKEGSIDNFNQILPIYAETVAEPQPVLPDLDKVVLKSARGITLHRPSDWVDDMYTLVGEAQMIKRDYETAENTFRWIRDEYNPNSKLNKAKIKKESQKKKKQTAKKKQKEKKKALKKKKKAAEKKQKAKKKAQKQKRKAKSKGKTVPKTTTAAPAPDPTPEENKKKEEKKKKKEEEAAMGINPYKKGAKRTAAYPKAMILYGRTLVEREKYSEAEFLYRELQEDMWFPADLKDDLATAEAYLWIKQKRYDKAIAPLQTAIALTKKKKTRARLSYILAQLSYRNGDYALATSAFETVLDNKPSYEMVFNANLRYTVGAWNIGRITTDEAFGTMTKMLKDDKNIEYQDQIYFTSAEIALKEGMRKDAIAYLHKSLTTSKGNTVQKAESYLMLADLYFEDENFVAAKSYYDSTLTVLQNTDERFKRVTDYAANLTDIARLITTIAANDSIIRVYNMSDDQRKELAKSIKKQRDEEASKAAVIAANQTAAAPKVAAPQAGVKTSSFYFYNESFVKKGKKDFTKQWGNRKLEDNWRRSIRPTAAVNDQYAISDSTKAGDISDTDVSDIFANIPRSDAELAVLHMSTYEAMYNLGVLFRDKLQNNTRCSGTLEDLLVRYPDTTKYQKETWYYCYLAFTDLNNPSRAQFYYDKLLDKYPTSPYARAISDPNFLAASLEREREMNRYYEQTFDYFQKGDYQSAFDRCQDAPRKYGSTNPLAAKFALLSALCTGNLQGSDAYCKALQEVIARYPESAEATRAKEIARVLSCKGFEVAAKKDQGKSGSADGLDMAFTLENDKLHYFIVALSGDVKLDDLKAAVSDYNREFHKTEQLRISNIFLGTDTNTPLLVVRKFDTKEQAMRYFNEVKDRKEFLGETASKKYNKEFFAITQENYRRVLKNKTLSGYREFFGENYLK